MNLLGLLPAIVLLAAPVAGVGGAPAAAPLETASYQETFELVRRQLDVLCTNAGDGYPYHTEGGKWKYTGPSEWTAGYFPGMLWMVYGHTKDPVWLERARRWTGPIAAFRNDRADLNFGLLFMPTFVAGHRLTQEPLDRQIALEAAEALTLRYMPEGQYIRSWGRVGDPREQAFIIIDCLIDLNLLYWAAKETGEAHFAEIATSHARVTADTAVREDGSSVQVIELDPKSGKKVADRHKQAYSPQSCWSRGQAFGIYALTEVFQATGEQRFLDDAQRMADYWIEHLPDDLVPYWDFRAPKIPNEVRDSSAAALAAGGLWELSNELKNTARGKRYRRVALDTLDSLTRLYMATGDARAEGRMLVHAALHQPAGIAIDESLILGDYYYLEMLLKVMKDQPAGE